jgi:hypothetical protein
VGAVVIGVAGNNRDQPVIACSRNEALYPRLLA